VLLGARGLRAFQRLFAWVVGYKRRLPRTRRNLPGSGEADGAAAPLSGRLMLRLAEVLLDERTLAGALVKRLTWAFHRLVRRARRLNNVRLLRRGAVGTAWTVLDFGCALIKGIIAHGLVVSDQRRASDPRATDPNSGWGYYDRLDQWDFRDWLRYYGASPETRGSPLVRMIYDAAFSYRAGGRFSPRTGELTGEEMGAGTVLRIMLLMGFTYKHAFYFKMRAGMGDVIAAPLYEVLRQRGVQFRFFHRLKSVALGDNDTMVDQLDFEVLAETDGDSDYQPLEEAGGLLTWPAKPDAEQILPEHYDDACNADRYFHKLSRKPRVLSLTRKEFDVVVLAIPSSCVAYAAPELVRAGERAAASPAVYDPRSRWRDVPELATVQTLALQLWFKLSLEELGWDRSPPLLSLFHDPLNTWCDMSQTLDQERWPEGSRPRSVAYFCGPLPDEIGLPSPARLAVMTPAELAALDAKVLAEADAGVADLLDTLEQLLPNVRGSGAGEPRRFAPRDPNDDRPPRFNWSLLVDPEHRHGPARLAAQFRRANYELSERCALALPGQTQRRVPAGDTGYANLVVAGDWTRNGINAACFEGAVQSGIRAARAVSDHPALYVIRAERLVNLEANLRPRPGPDAIVRLPRARRKSGGLRGPFGAPPAGQPPSRGDSPS
jgi:hypothetical protein